MTYHHPTEQQRGQKKPLTFPGICGTMALTELATHLHAGFLLPGAISQVNIYRVKDPLWFRAMLVCEWLAPTRYPDDQSGFLLSAQKGASHS